MTIDSILTLVNSYRFHQVVYKSKNELYLHFLDNKFIYTHFFVRFYYANTQNLMVLQSSNTARLATVI